MSRILIAEDDPVSRILVTKIVEELGHTVCASPDGKHAYDALVGSEGFDLLISDIMMPHMDGEQLVAALRGGSRYRDLPIIMVSATVGYREIQHLLDSGVTYFLPKPVNAANLVDTIDRCLAGAA